MGTSRDLYTESELLAKEFEKRDEHDSATRIRDAISGGATSTEILFRLRWELNRLLDGRHKNDAELTARVKDLRAGVVDALK
ncbi:MAG: hypothetical protein JHC87_06955 [Thermoleophilaceae bacterium]|nr:hypothetical protein [Thermoleophilaceae bacterium]